MGQKVHPIGYRLGVTANHSSQWFSKVGYSSNYASFLAEDTFIRDFFLQKSNTIQNIFIQRKNTALFLHIETNEPQEILKNLDSLKEEFQKKMHIFRKNKEKNRPHTFFNKEENAASEGLNSDQSTLSSLPDYSLFCTVSQVSDVSAQSTAFFIKDQLEKRLPFRRAVKKSLKLAKMRGLKGMKIQISGRLNGAEIARTECERFGAVPLQTLRTPIDYTICKAHTIYGVLGIKVWVQY